MLFVKHESLKNYCSKYYFKIKIKYIIAYLSTNNKKFKTILEINKCYNLYKYI